MWASVCSWLSWEKSQTKTGRETWGQFRKIQEIVSLSCRESVQLTLRKKKKTLFCLGQPFYVWHGNIVFCFWKYNQVVILSAKPKLIYCSMQNIKRHCSHSLLYSLCLFSFVSIHCNFIFPLMNSHNQACLSGLQTWSAVKNNHVYIIIYSIMIFSSTSE